MVTFLRFFAWPIFWGLVAFLTSVVSSDFWPWLWTWIWADPWRLLLPVSFFAGTKYVMAAIRCNYAIYHSRKLVHMKVLLPRSDSKIDQEKRTEKDFKEKIAIMEQLYRALWEVRSLTFWQTVHFWFFRYATISFEIYMEKNELSFHVLAKPSLVSIVEKQITSFYSDAEVMVVPAINIWPKGYKLVGYHMALAKKFYYPIRFYEQMQDDPLNDMSNVLSKLDDG